MAALSPADLDAIPRMGWVREATPVTPLPQLAAALGLGFLGVKRDDRLEPFHGGNKPRKLDYLLAAPPFSSAPVWAAVGGIGSGALVALTGAAQLLGRRVEAHLFWTALSQGVLDNLVFTASGPTTIRFYPSRAALALRWPAVLGLGAAGGTPVVPPGATSPAGMIGMVRAGLELGAQIHAGELPEPDAIYLAFGSGGTAVGLATGLALAGVKATVAAVAVVERLLSTRARIHALSRTLARELARWGIDAPAAPIAIDHAHLGRGYGDPSKEAIAACHRLEGEGLDLEPVYTGKAMAALLADARGRGLRNVLFWHTARRGPLPRDPGWRDRLPPELARRLDAPQAPARRVTRRRALVALGAAAAAGAAVRVTGYPPLPGFRGEVLAAWEAHVVLAAAEALLAPAASVEELGSIAARVDRYLTGMPPSVLREVHAMLALVEHGTTPLAGRLHRFTLLPAGEREAYLSGLEARGGQLSQAYRALRDLCVLALYQQPSTWSALGYDGPRMPLGYDPRGPDRWAWKAYDALLAPEGALPRGLVR